MPIQRGTREPGKGVKGSGFSLTHSYCFFSHRFPWESAYTGTEVTNPCCPEVAQQEIHISPDIVFAMQKHFAQSNDYVWLCEHSWPIVADVAEFLLSRASCEESHGPCHFRNVMGPDEDHANVDDNVYTNAVAKIALDFAAWTGERCGVNNTELYQKWRDLKDRLVIVHDATRDYHPQHLGYELNAIVKQADTILLGYPLQFDTRYGLSINSIDSFTIYLHL